MRLVPTFLRPACDALYQRASRGFDRILDGVEKREIHDDSDYLADAEWAMAEQKLRGSRIAVLLTCVAVLALIVWAAFAPLDEVTRGEGKVIPSRQVQVMQSLDGGIVSEILVREGEQVKSGQLLLKVDPTRFVSSLRENRAQYEALLARAARLTALAHEKPFVPPPELIKSAPALVEQERSAYEAKRMELDAAVGVARQQLSQRRQELNEVSARREQATQSYNLTARELEVTRPLAKTGAVSEVELLRLERDVARYRGERDAAGAQIPRIQAAISEAQRKIEEVELNMRNQARNELSETNAKLAALSAGSEGLADRVKQAEIRAPMNGTVKQLFANTVGGVVQPGKEIIEIVPSDDALLLEARVQPKDIAFLRPGQPAHVKFTAYDFSIYGGLDATLEHIGADTITDDKGNAFYIVRVRTTQSSIGEAHMPIIPGMVAEVDILTGKKSLLSYLMKPVLRAKANALTER
ncbi:HlyD family type I secretion periplasmic adaptor subunit [Zoogloea ramigera]|uniref:Membrane fusion protein (MFP) family protein n=1 Tax=Zoogloea ramigera TaxID=350 RepID=A0A4Y4CWX5_ZOORA|nr:HlyD family type I secretion periplasmic adaptor subunit [Zoogloea ramigera]GEC95040.1 HlyD family type I secretion periplasmic adaptor subunit [Zoogloea ramigera]